MKAMKKVLFLMLVLAMALTTVAFADDETIPGELPTCPICRENTLEWIGDAKKPTCENAITAKVKCSKDGCFSGSVTLEALGHDVDEVEEDESKYVAPTCTTEGSKTYVGTCKRPDCGKIGVTKVVTVPVEKHGALLTDMAAKKDIASLKILDAATKLTYAQAEQVKASFEASLNWAGATDHLYERAHLKTKLSENVCVNANTLELYCDACDYKVTWNIAGAADHDWTKIADKCQAPTCTEVGYDYYVCTICTGIDKVVEVKAKGHDYKWGEAETELQWVLQNGEFLNDATKAAGYKACTEAIWVKRCEVPGCGHYEKVKDIKPTIIHGSEEFFKNNKPYSTVAATCTEDGKNFVKCPECGEIIEQKINALQHDWQHVKYNPVSTCTTGGKEEQECTRCHVTQTIDLIPNGHKYVPTTIVTNDCNTDIYTIDICETCGDRDESSKVVIGKGHTPAEVRGLKNVGLKFNLNVKSADEANLPSVKEQALDFTNWIPSTCGVEASVTYYCSQCTKNYTVDRTVAKCDFDYTKAGNFKNGAEGVKAYAEDMAAEGKKEQNCKNDVYHTVECFNEAMGRVIECKKTDKVLVAEKCDCFGVRLDGTNNYDVKETIPGNCTTKAKEVRVCKTCGDVKTTELDYVHDLKLSGGKWVCQREGCDYTEDFKTAMKVDIDTSKIVLTSNSCSGEGSVKLEGVTGDVYARITVTYTMSDGDKLTIVQAVKVTKSADGKTGTFEIPSYQLPKGTLTNFFVTITPDSGSAAMPLGSVNKLAWVTLK